MEKGNIIAGLGVSIITYFSPSFGLFMLITIATMLDHVFGVWRVVSLEEPFKFWGGVRKTLSKIAAYMAIISGFYILDKQLLNEFSLKWIGGQFMAAKIITLVLCYNEWLSINRNFKDVTGFSMIERFNKVIRGIRKIIEKVMEIKNKFFTVLLLVLLGSCSPIYRHDRLVRKYPYVHTVIDTVERVETLRVYVPGAAADTVFWDKVRKDTVTLYKDRLTVKYFRDGDTVYLSGKCDPIVKRVPYTIKSPVIQAPLSWWQYPVVIFGFCVVCLGIGYFRSKNK